MSAQKHNVFTDIVGWRRKAKHEREVVKDRKRSSERLKTTHIEDTRKSSKSCAFDKKQRRWSTSCHVINVQLEPCRVHLNTIVNDSLIDSVKVLCPTQHRSFWRRCSKPITQLGDGETKTYIMKPDMHQ